MSDAVFTSGRPRRMMRSQTDPLTGGRASGGGRDIPPPIEPQEPVLGALGGPGRAMRGILDVRPAVFPLAGRHAIALALRHAGLKPGDRVLVPEYHCQAMIDPVLRLGAEPVIFPLADDLSVDVSRLAPLAEGARALLAVHYFGFVQDFRALATFCRERDIIFIEDCAHCVFGEAGGQPVGAAGDYAIASLRKFLPLRDGAVLVSARRDISALALTPPSATAAAKGWYRMLEQATAHGRLGLLGPVIRAVEAGRSGPVPQPASAAAPAVPAVAGAEGVFAASMERMALPASLRALARRLAGGAGAGVRRRNFERLLAGLADLPGCRPLAVAGEAQAPYLCPLWMDDLVRIFPRLEDAALPMQRFGQFPWAGMDMEAHPLARELAAHVVQFSCHQSLTEGEIDHMIRRIRAAVTGGPPIPG